MEKRFAYYIVAGLAIGALLGMGVGSANGNLLASIGSGAALGVFVGWFAAAAAMRAEKPK
jgi:hypothetical protein